MCIRDRVGTSNGGLSTFLDALHQLIDPAGTVQKAVFCMQMQVDELLCCACLLYTSMFGVPAYAATVFMTMCVSALALTSLDAVARIGRMSFQELFSVCLLYTSRCV